MAITKLNLPPTQNEVVKKINEVIDGKQNTLVAGNCIELTQSILPSEYTRLEYIRATGTQYINTGYIPIVGDEVYIKYRFTTVGSDSSTFYCLLSAGASPNVNDYQLIMIEGKSTSIPAGGFFYKYFANGSATTLSFSPVVDTWYTANITSGGVLTTGGVSETSTPAGEISGADKNLYLFIRANMASPFLGDIAEMTITNNGTTKLSLIPVKRNSDNVLGMYDTVTGNFLINSGTGSFTAGNVAIDETYINFVNNSGFITKAVDDLTNYYTKSQTYTKTEVQQLIAAIPNFSVEVVSSLPAEGETMTLYLVPKTGTAPDVYEEYVWVSSTSSYELLGTTAVDLTGYLQTSDIATTVSASSTNAEVVGAKLYYDNRTDFYGTCSTARATQTKAVTTDSDFVLRTGVSIRVKFADYQAYNGTPKLNVNNTGSINIVANGSTSAARYYWKAGEIISFTYDGTYWVMEDGGTADTTYYGYTRLNISATSTSATMASTPSALNAHIRDMISSAPVFSDSSTYAVGDRVRYDYKTWECNTAITTAGSWNAAKWTALDPIQTQIDGKQDTSNLVTSISASSTDTTYPSAKCVYDGLDGKQDTLVSGTNIKTINNTSLLGSGNIEIQGGGTTYKAGTDIVIEEIELDTNLPSEYTQVNGLYCNGYQYVTTDYYPNSKTVIKGSNRFNGKYPGTQTNNIYYSGYAFGTYDGTNMYSFGSGKYPVGSDSITSNGVHWSAGNVKNVTVSSIKLYNYEISSSSCTINETTNTFSNPIVTATYPLRIGAVNNYTDAQKLIGWIYPIEISEDGVVVKNYIPCRRNSDDVLGIYETVSDTFLTNEGTGNFTTNGDAEAGTFISFDNDGNILTRNIADSYYQTKGNLVTTIRTSGTDFTYPSENAVKAYAQPKLESGVNIKTLNGYSLLGSGDLLNNTSGIGWDAPVTISGISSGYSFLKCYANGEFICINGSKVFTSTDGINWTEKGTLPEASDPYDADWQSGGLVYGNGTYVAVDYYGFVSTSTDLETWTTPVYLGEVEPDYYGIGVEYFSQLLFFNGNFHVFGLNGTGVSSDGVNWTISAPLSIITDNNVFHFAYKGGTLIGITDVDSSGICQVYKSTDYGVTWSSTPVEIEFPAEAEGNTLITTTDNKFVIVTTSGYTTISEDGDTWEEPAYNDNLAPITHRLWVGLAYGNSKLVILSWRKEVSIANVNAGKTIIIVNSYSNGTSFCDVYSDGKCIQGGIATGGTTNSGAEILFLKPFADANYILLASGLTRSNDNFGTYAVATAKVRNLSTTSFYASTSYRGASSSGAYQPYQFSWLAIGKIGSSS